MTNVEFKNAVREFQSKFKELENSVIVIENDGDVHACMQGNIIGTINALIDVAHSDPAQFAILLTVGEVLRKDLSPKAISALTRMHLKNELEKNVN
jgi:hypothetical protein